ncbi:MAG: 1-(5-phosphoribosyl)-5-amino-4-imidazole-carboxylate carboxylase, partial [Leptolyngbya sp. SIO1D8]|nr:1-(5-phosphoribosyl)-5-amino-4-imidazole-carboxylate carboxylase [Leptolyngbya sp. SIO1D8]
MTQPEALQQLLQGVAQGQVSPEAAFDKLKYLEFEPVDEFAKVDHHRSLRTGFPEVIWGPGKTVDQIVQIMQAMRDHTPVVMATRIEPDVAQQLRVVLPELMYYEAARICALVPINLVPKYPGTIGILT